MLKAPCAGRTAPTLLANPDPRSERPFTVYMGSTMSHATARMNQSNSPPGGFPSAAPYPSIVPRLKHCPELTCERCEGLCQRTTLPRLG